MNLCAQGNKIVLTASEHQHANYYEQNTKNKSTQTMIQYVQSIS